MDNGVVITEDLGSGVTRLTINRPEVHNAFDGGLIAHLTETLRRLGDDTAVRCVLLAARGKSFSAGADLRWMRRMADFSYEENRADALRLATLLRTLNELPKPTVACVHGPAYGGGVGLVAACDISVAAEDAAVFALTEVRLGLIPAVISPYVIAAIGRRQAQRYFLTGERFDAREAVRIGLVHLAVPCHDLEHAAWRIIEALGAGGAGALADAKTLIRLVAERNMDDGLAEETADRIARARATEEARARIGAFLEKQGGGGS